MKFARSVGELRFVRLFKNRGENLFVVQPIMMKLITCTVT